MPGGEGNASLPSLNVLLRRDLKSGQVNEWLRRPLTAPGFQLLGFYGGTPAVLVFLAGTNDPRWNTGKVPYLAFLAPRTLAWRPGYEAINGTGGSMVGTNLGIGTPIASPAAPLYQNYLHPLLFVGAFLPAVVSRLEI